MRPLIKLIIIYQFAALVSTSFAESYTISSGSDIVGQAKYVSIPYGYDLFRVGHKYNIGFHEMVEANPRIDPWNPRGGSKVLIPSEYILPNYNKNRDSIVVNLPELRMYFFPKNSNIVYTYPVGIGQKTFPTPTIQNGYITAKRKHPTWTVPDSVKEQYAARGEEIPDVVDAGPGNPLGDYAMNLSAPSYLLHGTNDPLGVGLRISHGCIRMYPEDIKALYSMVSVGTAVNFINKPYKIGIDDNELYLETHEPLSENDNSSFKANEIAAIKAKLSQAPFNKFQINWNEVNTLIQNPVGIPIKIGTLN